MPRNKIETIWNVTIDPTVRYETLDDREYVVAPMTMILEGVHTGSQGPVYYDTEELAKTPKMWNFKPVVIEHPFRGDTATDLEVYKRQAVGMIMNTHFVDGKLKAEAWIDRRKAEEKCPTLLEHIKHRLPMEISTGLFSELIMDEGVWNSEPYIGRIINIRADHLAILPRKQGACSLSDGAGLLINERKEMKAGETLNIITTYINNDYLAGSPVMESTRLFREEQGHTDAKNANAHGTAHTEIKVAVAPPLESMGAGPVMPGVQSFTTAEGYKITIEPPTGPAKVASLSEAMPDTPEIVLEEVPAREEMQDNPEIVASDDLEEGEDLFVSTVKKLRNAAQVLVTSFNEALILNLLNDARGGFKFRQTEDGLWESASTGRPKGSFDSEEVEKKNAERKRLRAIAVDIRTRIAELEEKNAKLLKAKKPLDPADLRELENLDVELKAAQAAVLSHIKKYGDSKADSLPDATRIAQSTTDDGADAISGKSVDTAFTKAMNEVFAETRNAMAMYLGESSDDMKRVYLAQLHSLASRYPFLLDMSPELKKLIVADEASRLEEDGDEFKMAA